MINIPVYSVTFWQNKSKKLANVRSDNNIGSWNRPENIYIFQADSAFVKAIFYKINEGPY